MNEKVKDSLISGGIVGLSYYFISQNQNIGLLGLVSGSLTTYTKYEKLEPFIIRVKKDIYGENFWITNWNGEKIKTPDNTNITVIDEEITASDVARYSLAPFTFGLSLRL
jgi:hypothetical protein